MIDPSKDNFRQIDLIEHEIHAGKNDYEPVLVQCIGAHNEEELIEAQLASIYDEVDRILIAEGAVEGRPESTDDGHSTDNTIELIEEFDDPANKINLIQIDRHWRSLEEQKQSFLEVAEPGDWLLITDCDEFYHPEDVRKIRKAIKRKPWATEFIPMFLHFYKDFRHIVRPAKDWVVQHQRIIRNREGLKYLSHPVATDKNGVGTCLTPQYQQFRFHLPDVYIYHYGHTKSKEALRNKSKFYKKELSKYPGMGNMNASEEFDKKTTMFLNDDEPAYYVLRYDGEHPEVIKEHLPDKYNYEYPSWNEEVYETMETWSEVEPYSLQPYDVPNIYVWMHGDNPKMQRIVRPVYLEQEIVNQ